MAIKIKVAVEEGPFHAAVTITNNHIPDGERVLVEAGTEAEFECHNNAGLHIEEFRPPSEAEAEAMREEAVPRVQHAFLCSSCHHTRVIDWRPGDEVQCLNCGQASIPEEPANGI